MSLLNPTVPTVKCNRCRKILTAQSSIIRGIGPVCARNILRHLGQGLRGRARQQLLQSLYAEDINARILRTYDDLIVALTEGEYLLDTDHRPKLEELLTKSSRVSVVEYVLVIYADVCNQLCTATTVAEATKHFFYALGLGDEAEKAYKRLIKIAKKACTF